MKETYLLFVYIAVINIIPALIVIYDKSISRLPRGSVRRIPEKTFLFFSVFGGGIGTLFTMLLIRHKTRSHNGLLLKICALTAVWIAIILFLITKMQ
ncbi:MAG: DUF1294 domain-containing protein [Clostridia bacterium]|nr:DUF1294 domain-containing protein [Clostridia bacterium]